MWLAYVDMFEHHQNASRAWNGIVHGAQVLTQLRVDVGNDNATLFWLHHWLKNTSLSDGKPHHIPDDILNAIVGECWKDWRWDWNTISPFLKC